MSKRAFLASLLLVACSSTPPAVDGGLDAAHGDDVGEVLPEASVFPGDLARDYCAPLAAFVCGTAAECGCGAVLPGGELDVGACTPRWMARCLEAWQPFVDAGARIDSAAAAACVTRTREATPRCGRPQGTVPFALCAPFAIAPAALGGACTSPYCAGGLGRCLAGTCAPALTEGAACADMFGCAAGLACNEGTCRSLVRSGACAVDLDCAPPLACLDGTCAALGELGSACSSELACAIGLACIGGACAEPSPTACDDGTTCGHDATCGGLRLCAQRGAEGAACSEDRDCDGALYCDDARRCATRPALGAPCAHGTLCAPGLACDGDGGACATPPSLGDACAFGELGPFVCADGLGCLGGICGALPGEGEPCASDNRCADGLGCDFSPAGSFCIVPRTLGGACESDRSCAAAFHCGSGGLCAADLPTGAPCSVGNECAGVCGPSAAGGLACRDAPTRGDACVFSDECPEDDTCRAPSVLCVPPICREL